MTRPRAQPTAGTGPALLEIRDLRVRIAGKTILDGLDLTVQAGEVHAIMGPNGSGKSTLAQVLAGNPLYQVIGGEIRLQGLDISRMAPDERAREGLFLAFQYPVEIPGVSTINLIKEALNAQRKHRGEPELDALDLLALVKEKLAVLQMDEGFLKRAVNTGFSGGEKKRSEILQLLVTAPRLAVLDEIDSGLDIDALQIVAAVLNELRRLGRTLILITHYPRLLEYIQPDHIHVLSAGRILASGGHELAHHLEKFGYAELERQGARTGQGQPVAG